MGLRVEATYSLLNYSKTLVLGIRKTYSSFPNKLKSELVISECLRTFTYLQCIFALILGLPQFPSGTILILSDLGHIVVPLRLACPHANSPILEAQVLPRVPVLDGS